MLQGDGQQLEARDLARMLDLLDRQLNADSKGGDSPQPNAPTTASERDPKSSNTSSNSEIQTNQSSKSGQSQEDRTGSRSAFKDSVKSAAEKLAGLMGQGRLAQRSAAQARKNARSDSQANQSKGSRADRDLSNIEAGEDFVLPGMNRVQNRDWGKLRDQRTKDAVEGRRDELDPEFEEAIQAYYRALGNR